MDPQDPAVLQATAIAEALLPQVDERIQARMDRQVAEMQRQSIDAWARDVGLVGPDGSLTLTQPTPPPVDPRAAARPFASFGEQLQSIITASRPGGIVDSRLSQIAAATGLSEGVASDGGFLLQDTFSSEIWRRENDTGQVYNRITKRYPLGGNSTSIKLPAIDETSRANGSRWGGIQAYWVPEAGTFTPSQPSLARIALELHKLTVLAYATAEQLADTPLIEGLLSDAFAEEFGFNLDDKCIRGNGVGEPLGILNAASTISVAKETGQAANTFVYENALAMWTRLYARSRSNAVWFINQDVETQLYRMSLAIGTGGVPVFLPAGGASGSQYSSLFGRPIIPIEQCSTLGTVGDVILADMSQFWAIDKGGPNYASSIHVQFLTEETAFRGSLRVDYRPMWLSALTPANGTTTVSPFITLATRA
jgi:HK97 family phage major capsid protein